MRKRARKGRRFRSKRVQNRRFWRAFGDFPRDGKVTRVQGGAPASRGLWGRSPHFGERRGALPTRKEAPGAPPTRGRKRKNGGEGAAAPLYGRCPPGAEITAPQANFCCKL